MFCPTSTTNIPNPKSIKINLKCVFQRSSAYRKCSVQNKLNDIIQVKTNHNVQKMPSNPGHTHIFRRSLPIFDLGGAYPGRLIGIPSGWPWGLGMRSSRISLFLFAPLLFFAILSSIPTVYKAAKGSIKVRNKFQYTIRSHGISNIGSFGSSILGFYYYIQRSESGGGRELDKRRTMSSILKLFLSIVIF